MQGGYDKKQFLYTLLACHSVAPPLNRDKLIALSPVDRGERTDGDKLQQLSHHSLPT